jgi:hypothetical protein
MLKQDLMIDTNFTYLSFSLDSTFKLHIRKARVDMLRKSNAFYFYFFI